jgi:hypothetical protein
MTRALSKCMMPTWTVPNEHSYRPHCSREEAARLLEGLRAVYQSLSRAEQGVVKAALWQKERVQASQEMDQESECCA